MHLALVQPLYRAWHTREYTRISIDGTIGRYSGRRSLEGPYSFVRLFHRKKVSIFNSIPIASELYAPCISATFVPV